MLRNESTTPTPLSPTGFARPAARTRYPWFFFYVSKAFLTGLCVSVVVIGSCLATVLWYIRRGGAAAPRSSLGLAYALLSLACFIASAIGYSRARRSSRRAIGQLNAALQWHVFFAIMGLALALLHSFGHLEKMSGTLSLWGLVAVASSGALGRMLDRVLPRLIAIEVNRALTGQGDNVLETSLSQADPENRLPANVLEYVAHGELQALRREQRYRALLRAWRILHIALVFVAVGLLCWHLIYAAQVLFFT